MKKKLSHVLAVTFMLFHFVFESSSNSVPRVQIKNSLVYGETVRFRRLEVNQYLSIPYAEPPVGPLRFKKTVPLKSFPNVLNAVNVPPACLQYREIPYPTYVNSSHKSEDCLYLNIWTPVDASSENRKAVMFWIHGGSFRFDSIQNSLYSGVVLAAFGDIIVVTVNYRLGMFGFFTSGTDDAPGNAGLWDVLEGLTWVKKNIAFFGGDTTRITIMGESAGSNIVGYLSVSPLAEGLYRRQIMQSGAPVNLQKENKAQNLVLVQETAKEANCANDTYTITDHPQEVVRCLQHVGVEELVRVEFQLKPNSSSDFLPQFGDQLLPEFPTKSVLEGNFRCEELFIGNNRDEGSLGLVMSHPEVFGFFGEKNAEINQTFGSQIVLEKLKGHPNLQHVIQQNLFANVSKDAYFSIRHKVQTTHGNLLIVCPSVYYAKKCAGKGAKVYFYLYNHRPSSSPWASWMGVVHFDEVQFVFGKPLLKPFIYQEDEMKLSKEMIRLWSNFVKYGKPDKYWPEYSEKHPDIQYIGKEIGRREYGQDSHKHDCKLFRPFFEQFSGIEVANVVE